MAVNENFLKCGADRKLFLAAAVGFPLLVLIGYFRTYYFRAFFDVKPLATSLVHVHAVVMTAWVIYFSSQIALIRSRNVRLHMSMGLAGIALAAIVVVVGMGAAYDAHLIRGTAPAGIDPHSFFLIPVSDMLLYIVFFGGAIYYRKRPTEHKSLMLLTALNFLTGRVWADPGRPTEVHDLVGVRDAEPARDRLAGLAHVEAQETERQFSASASCFWWPQIHFGSGSREPKHG